MDEEIASRAMGEINIYYHENTQWYSGNTYRPMENNNFNLNRV